MRNLWVQTKSPFAAWTADMAKFASSPAEVREFLMTVVGLGDANCVAMVDVSLVNESMQARWTRSSRVYCDVLSDFAPRARLSWYDRQDRLVDGDVEDLGALLMGLQPVEGAISRFDADSWAPVVVSGSRLDYSSGRLKRTIDEQIMTFSIYSDIWFPFVLGEAHPSCDGQRYFDNRELALRHTPRLNAYLSAVAQAVTARGGAWSVESDSVARTMAAWVTEQGVVLDGKVPPLMPLELASVPWSTHNA